MQGDGERTPLWLFPYQPRLPPSDALYRRFLRNAALKWLRFELPKQGETKQVAFSRLSLSLLADLGEPYEMLCGALARRRSHGSERLMGTSVGSAFRSESSFVPKVWPERDRLIQDVRGFGHGNENGRNALIFWWNLRPKICPLANAIS